MSGMNLVLPPDADGWVADVVDDDYRPVARAAIYEGATPIEVNPGNYLVRFDHPNGQRSSQYITVPPGEWVDVVPKAMKSHSVESEDIQALPSGPSGRPRRVRLEQPMLALRPEFEPDLPTSSGDDLLPPSHRPRRRRQSVTGSVRKVWHRAFVFDTARKRWAWRQLEVGSEPTPRPEPGWQLASPAESVSLLQVGGPSLPWRMMLLPPGKVSLTWRRDASTSHLDLGIEFAIRTEDRAADALLGFLRSGQVRAAATFADNLVAEGMLQAKIANPVRAAIGGYHLLGQGAWDQMHDWPANLDTWFRWLPDGAVIRGIQLLRQPTPDQPAATRSGLRKLVEASQRGIPLFTEGLRLLFDALRQAPKTAGIDPITLQSASLALDWVTPYAASANWTEPYTTFYGRRPESPSIEPAHGRRPGDAELFPSPLELVLSG